MTVVLLCSLCWATPFCGSGWSTGCTPWASGAGSSSSSRSACSACAALIPVGIGWWSCKHAERSTTASWGMPTTPSGLLVTAYYVLCWAVASVTLLRLVYLRLLLPAAAFVRFHGRRRAEIDPAAAARRRRAGPSLADPAAAERNPATGGDPVDARRAAIAARARRTVDRPSLRLALHRPRGQGLFPRGRSHQQRTAARSGVHHRRHRRSADRASTGSPTRSGSCPRGTACISSWATTTAASMPTGFAARWNRAGWSTSAAAGCRSRSTARPSCWPATSGRGSTGP